MEPILLVTAAVAFVGAQIAQKCADAVIDESWRRIKAAFRRDSGEGPTPSNLHAAIRTVAIDQGLLAEAEIIVGHTSALRRATLAAKALTGAHILWVDDHPENNEWERLALGAFGVQFVNVLDSHSAVECLRTGEFDLVVSDISRGGAPDEGIRALPRLRAAVPTINVILYTGSVDGSAPRPIGCFGVTDRPDELIHLVLDVLERTRI